MNLDIKKRIDAIAHPDAIKLFFYLINQFIENNSISENDERFVLNVRNDYRKRFSVNLNSRLILYIKDENEFGFMIDQDDWANFENISILKKESFEKYEPAAFLVTFSFDEVVKNKDLITKYWLKSCREYLPSQKKSQYKKHHIEELFNIATNNDLLDKYLNDSLVTYSRFHQIITDFKDYIKSEDSKLNNFEIQKVYDDYVWISDNVRIIGKSGFCHYELITRKEYPQKIWIELHFDKKWKTKARKLLINVLGDDFFWNSDHKGGELSLALKENIDFNNEDLFAKLENGIIKIEDKFGQIVRDFYLQEKGIQEEKIKNTMQNIPLNQILYGPPGTGKTYNTINKAISIAKPDFDLSQARDIVKEEYARLVEAGQVVFTTFHQSMSYEDFIEGIKPLTKNEQVLYSVQDGLFKSLVRNALIDYLPESYEGSQNDDFDSIYNDYVNSIKSFENKREGIFSTKTGVEMMLVDANDNSILVKYLWSNKNKNEEGQHTFSVTKEKLKKVLLEGIEPSKVKSLKSEIHPIVGHIHCELFAVYKSFYEFVIANKGEVEAVHFNYQDQSYEEIKEQYDALEKEVKKNKFVNPFILIIDEINRGNVSQIFGELITLIEESKRLGNPEELQVTLPYSKEKFGVPSNLYIIGTMNTADRSVEALDTALRRRFSFVEMMPDLEVVEKEQFSDYRRVDVMQKINNRIELLLDRNYTLGHSYFIKDDFKSSFKNEIIPLLQEYFYNDCSKIGLILGRGFVREKEISKFSQTNVFADFDIRSEIDILKSYELIPFEEVTFDDAIDKLLA